MEETQNINIEADTDFNDDFLPAMPTSTHNEVLDRLLSEIEEKNIREIIGLPDAEDIKQKHILIAVSTHVLNTARLRKWTLCQAWDFVYLFNGCYWKQCSKDDMRKISNPCCSEDGSSSIRCFTSVQ